MKKFILSAILFLGLTATGFSQQRQDNASRTPEERAQRVTDDLEKKLSLTAEQKTAVYTIYLERAKAMSAARAENKQEDMEQRKAQMEANDAKILALLNDAQKVAYTKIIEERKQRMMNGGEQGQRQGDKKTKKEK